MLIAEFDQIVNIHTSTYFTKLAISRWFGAALDWATWGSLNLKKNHLFCFFKTHFRILRILCLQLSVLCFWYADMLLCQ